MLSAVIATHSLQPYSAQTLCGDHTYPRQAQDRPSNKLYLVNNYDVLIQHRTVLRCNAKLW